MAHDGPSAPSFVDHRPTPVPIEEGLRRGRALHELSETRRSVRHFADTPVPYEAIEIAVRVANTAPSGAHQQPWTFVATGDPVVKRRIREAAEQEERAFYHERDVSRWREAVAPLGTDAHKEYLEVVPWLVVAFAQRHTVLPDGTRRKNYYVSESVGLACGLFVNALHTMGLATLTHTPSPMGFLRDILGRPATERPFILFPVGYPAADCRVPDLRRKPLAEALVRVDR